MINLLDAHTDAEIISEASTAYYMASGKEAVRIARDECAVRRDGERGVRVRLADEHGTVIALYQVTWYARRMRFAPCASSQPTAATAPAAVPKWGARKYSREQKWTKGTN